MKQNNNQRVFCMKCFKNKEFVVKEEEKMTEYEGKIVKYTRKSTYCAQCGEPVHVKEIALENMKAIKEAYNNI